MHYNSYLKIFDEKEIPVISIKQLFFVVFSVNEARSELIKKACLDCKFGRNNFIL